MSTEGRAIRLLFVGGSTDSLKSKAIDHLARRLTRGLREDDTDEVSLRVSRYLAEQVGKRRGRELGDPSELQGLIDSLPLYEWKDSESDAVDGIIATIIRAPGPVGLRILNCHFASYSPSDYMMGLEVSSLEKICDKVYRDAPRDEGVLVGVILVDRSIDAILEQKREEMQASSYSVPAVLDDLRYNRLYSLIYYSVLSGLLGPQCVKYRRIVNRDSDHCARDVLECIRDDWGMV